MRMLDPMERSLLLAAANSCFPFSRELAAHVARLGADQRMQVHHTPDGSTLFRNTWWGDKALRVDAIIRAGSGQAVG